jgi:hypothetical protein
MNFIRHNQALAFSGFLYPKNPKIQNLEGKTSLLKASID